MLQSVARTNRVSIRRLALACVFVSACAPNPGTSPTFSDLQGPYLDQAPPGSAPVLFAPGLLSLGSHETNITFAPDGMSFAYTLSTGGDQLPPRPAGPFKQALILYAEVGDNHWTEPREFPFIPHRAARYPNFSPDGRKMFFNQRTDPSDSLATGIWFVERQGSGWSEPQEIRFGPEFEGERRGVFPTVAANGNLYFAIFPDGENGVLCMSRYADGRYRTPERLDEQIRNNGNHPFIAPDESYLVFDWEHPDEAYGENDLLISFRGRDGRWMKAQNLGPGVNTRFHDWRPFVSFDGKYLFFSSNRTDRPELPDAPVTLGQVREATAGPANGFQHLYWVDARVIEDLRPVFGE